MYMTKCFVTEWTEWRTAPSVGSLHPSCRLTITLHSNLTCENEKGKRQLEKTFGLQLDFMSVNGKSATKLWAFITNQMID